MKPEEEGKVQQTTQSMTPVDATQIMPKAPTAVKKNIRELNPVEIKDETVPQTGHRRKYVILAGGFLAALFLGFVLSGYYHDKQQLSENDRLQQEQSFSQREGKLKQQEAALREQRIRLEQQKQELEQQQRDLEAQAERAKGKNEQIAADEKKGSAMGKLWDKVTGKEKERQQTVQENTAQGDKASKDAAAIGSSIEQAQAMMNDVDARLQDLNDMRDQVQQMKQAAASAYAEHADVVDQVLHYAVEGVNVVKRLLAQ